MTDNQGTDVGPSAEAARLAQLRRLQKWIWASPLVGLPIIFLAGSARSEFGLVGFFVWVVAVFALIVRHLLFRCPRCNQYFNWSDRQRHTFADACVHCGLQRDARPQGQ
jgi:hypothetical protein